MTKLIEGKSAPDFSVRDHEGAETTLEAYRGRFLLLSFYRFASCPLCNLRVHRLIRENERLEELGLSMVAVFHSPADKLDRYVGRQSVPFPLLPDPYRELYRLYGVETSWPGFFKAWISRIGTTISAYRRGFTLGSFEGGLHGLPADFVIGPDGRIELAYYGRDAGDHIPIDDLERLLSQSRHKTAQGKPA